MVSITVILDHRSSYKNGLFPLKISVNFTPQIRIGVRSRNDKKFIALTDKEFQKLFSPKLKDETLVEYKKAIDNERESIVKILNTLSKYKKLTRENFEIAYGLKESPHKEKTPPKASNKRPDIYELFQSLIDLLPSDNGTAELYSNALSSFKEYRPKVSYQDLTPIFFKGYERFMLAKSNSITTVGIYCRSFRTAICEARRRRYIKEEEYPFGSRKKGKYTIPEGNSRNTPLSKEIIEQLISYKSEDDNENYALGMFLFSFYNNGINMRDIFHLQPDNFTNDVLQFKRIKTKRTAVKIKNIEIFLSKPILEILETWGTSHPRKDEYIFPLLNTLSNIKHDKTLWNKKSYRLISNQIRHINEFLLKIEKKLGIPIHLTTNVARHSWATYLQRKGVPISYISEGLGHTSIITTQRYLGGFTQDQKKEYSFLIANLE